MLHIEHQVLFFHIEQVYTIEQNDDTYLRMQTQHHI